MKTNSTKENTMKIKLMKHFCKNETTGAKCRCWYSKSTLIDGRKCVTIYSKSILENLSPVFCFGVENGTDITTDYFENDRVRSFPENDLYDRAIELAV